MKKLNLTKRDVAFFFLGLFNFLIVETLFDWQSSKKGFFDGWKSTKHHKTE